MNEKLVWHAPVFRSLDANRTAQADNTFVTDDSTSDDYVGIPGDAGGNPVPGGADAS